MDSASKTKKAHVRLSQSVVMTYGRQKLSNDTVIILKTRKSNLAALLCRHMPYQAPR